MKYTMRTDRISFVGSLPYHIHKVARPGYAPGSTDFQSVAFTRLAYEPKTGA